MNINTMSGVVHELRERRERRVEGTDQVADILMGTKNDISTSFGKKTKRGLIDILNRHTPEDAVDAILNGSSSLPTTRGDLNKAKLLSLVDPEGDDYPKNDKEDAPDDGNESTPGDPNDQPKPPAKEPPAGNQSPANKKPPFGQQPPQQESVTSLLEIDMQKLLHKLKAKFHGIEQSGWQAPKDLQPGDRGMLMKVHQSLKDLRDAHVAGDAKRLKDAKASIQRTLRDINDSNVLDLVPRTAEDTVRESYDSVRPIYSVAGAMRSLREGKNDEVAIGFAVVTPSQREIEAAYAEEFSTPLGDMTWRTINADIGRIEKNAVTWLSNTLANARSEGHSSDDALVGTTWVDTTNRKHTDLLSRETEFVRGGRYVMRSSDMSRSFAASLNRGVTSYGQKLVTPLVSIEFFDVPDELTEGRVKEFARKVTDEIMGAFLQGDSLRMQNSRTDGETVWLHGNEIARRHVNGDIEISDGGYGPSSTTRERLNGLLALMGKLTSSNRISINQGEWEFNGKSWDGGWTKVGKTEARKESLDDLHRRVMGQ